MVTVYSRAAAQRLAWCTQISGLIEKHKCKGGWPHITHSTCWYKQPPCFPQSVRASGLTRRRKVIFLLRNDLTFTKKNHLYRYGMYKFSEIQQEERNGEE